MARCDVCGNDYRRTMEIRYRAGLQALPLPRHRPRRRAR